MDNRNLDNQVFLQENEEQRGADGAEQKKKNILHSEDGAK